MDICASYLTLSGSAYGEPAKYDLLSRAKAAHAAGISSIGVSLDEFPDAEALKYAAIPECEWLDLSAPLSLDKANRLAAFRTVLGVTRVNVGVTVRQLSWQRADDNLKRILDITEHLGMTVAVEPVSFGACPLVTQVRDLWKRAGSPDHCGLLYDMYQVAAKNTVNLHDLHVPITEIQACGVRLFDNRDDFAASQDRLFLHESDVDPVRWLAELRAVTDAPLSYEVPNAKLRSLPLMKMAELAAADMSNLER